MLINRKIIRGFFRELREHGMESAFEVYARKLDDTVRSDTMWAIDQHEHSPYNCRGARYHLRCTVGKITSSFLKRERLVLDKSCTNVLFVLFGGLGDLIINRNYLLHLKTFLGDDKTRFYVTSDRDYEVLSSLIGQEDVRIIRLSDEYLFRHFDMIIRMIRYPVVIKANIKRIDVNKKLLEYVQANFLFQHDFRDILERHPYNDHYAMVKCMSEGKNRVQQPDFAGNLDLEKIDGYRIPSTGSEPLGADSSLPYITINRDSGWINVSKLWPIDNYLQLISRIKTDFPELQVVAIGENMDSRIRSVVDKDLVGKTNMDQLKVVLDRSMLHVSCEGFTVHLRHFMSSKPSVVLFGPTLERFYGYPENYNFSPSNTECWCEWKNVEWNQKCIKGVRTCLEEITVDEVYETIRLRLLNIGSS